MSKLPFIAVGRAFLAARSIVLPQVRNSSAYKPPASWKPPHLDELPVPQGSWKAYYDSKQGNYNMQLAFGILFFTSTLAFIVGSDRFQFNYAPPPLPEEK